MIKLFLNIFMINLIDYTEQPNYSYNEVLVHFLHNLRTEAEYNWFDDSG